MGFVAEGGPFGQDAVNKMGPRIVAALNKAERELAGGRAVEEVTRWFGTTRADKVEKQVTGLRRFYNFNPINVDFAPLKDKGKYTACVFEPFLGWGNHTNPSKANGRGFRIRLNVRWERKPEWSQKPFIHAGAGGQFKTLVHELSHLAIGANDIREEAANCILLATTHPSVAFFNADNWGFFVEEFA